MGRLFRSTRNKKMNITRKIKEVIKELSTASDFKKNWYAETTNQCGHFLLGFFGASLICGFYGMVFNEMPIRLFVVFGIFFSYLLLWEVTYQGFRGADSVWDSLFFTTGACVIFVFTEQSTTFPKSVVIVDWYLAFYVIFGFLFLLTMRVFPRIDVFKP